MNEGPGFHHSDATGVGDSLRALYTVVQGDLAVSRVPLSSLGAR